MNSIFNNQIQYVLNKCYNYFHYKLYHLKLINNQTWRKYFIHKYKNKWISNLVQILITIILFFK